MARKTKLYAAWCLIMIRRLLEWLRDGRSKHEDEALSCANLVLVGSGKKADAENVDAAIEVAERNIERLKNMRKQVDNMRKQVKL